MFKLMLTRPTVNNIKIKQKNCLSEIYKNNDFCLANFINVKIIKHLEISIQIATLLFLICFVQDFSLPLLNIAEFCL